MNVTKVVDLVTRNSEQLSLNFSDFSTNLHRFYKFTEKLENINTDLQRGPETFTKPPENLKLITQGSLAGVGDRGGGGGCFPARRRLAGGGDGVQG